MLACKRQNIADYQITMVPMGRRGAFKTESFAWNQLEWTAYYFLPCWNGQPINMILKAKREGQGRLITLKYEWRLYLVDKTGDTPKGEGNGILRGGGLIGEPVGFAKEDKRTVQDKLTIASECILIPSQYELQVQLYENGKLIKPWYTIATFDVVRWDDVFFKFAIAAAGILGIIVGVILTKLLQ